MKKFPEYMRVMLFSGVTRPFPIKVDSPFQVFVAPFETRIVRSIPPHPSIAPAAISRRSMIGKTYSIVIPPHPTFSLASLARYSGTMCATTNLPSNWVSRHLGIPSTSTSPWSRAKHVVPSRQFDRRRRSS